MEISAGEAVQSWIDPPRSGAWNMDRDRQLLYRVESSEWSLTVLRLYGWNGPTVSIGRNQDPSKALDLQFCERNRIPIIRRPTGGRAVLHAGEVTYAIASNDEGLFPRDSLLECYLQISKILQTALASLGIQCNLAPASRGREAFTHKKSPCFAVASRYELLKEGRKIAGSAQYRLRRSFLQHGSIPLKVDYEIYGRCLGVSSLALKQKMISVSEAAGRKVRFLELASALQDSFDSYLYSQGTGE